MKILQVAYKSDISGGEKVLFDLAVSLRERGHEVLAVCPDPGQLPAELEKSGIRTQIIPFHKTYDLQAARLLAHCLRREEVEILHSHSMLTNIISRVAGHWVKVPISVSTEHLPMELGRGGRGKGLNARIRSAYYRFLDNFTSRGNQAVIAVSESVKRDLVEQGIDEKIVVVIRNGIQVLPLDPRTGHRLRRELGLKEEWPVVGSVGRLSPQKDYVTFLRSARVVLDTLPEARFVIVGDGPECGELGNLAQILNVDQRAFFLGYRKDALEVISAFDLFAISSLWEGLPLSVLEAMSQAKPVVATSVPGTAEAVADGRTGFLVPMGDSSALAGKIIQLLRDPGRAKEMGIAGRKRVEELFSLKRMVDEHETLYRRLAERVGLKWH